MFAAFEWSLGLCPDGESVYGYSLQKNALSLYSGVSETETTRRARLKTGCRSLTLESGTCGPSNRIVTQL